MKPISILRASTKDAAAFYKLEAVCMGMKYDHEDTVYYWVPILEHQFCHKAVTKNGDMVGGIVSMHTANNQWYINSVFVHPGYRRQGIASRLIRMVTDRAGCEDLSVTLEVETGKPHLIHLYDSLGFVLDRTSFDHYGDGRNLYIMLWTPQK